MVDFQSVAQTALASSSSILAHWLPDGTKRGNEYLSRNPTRNDQALGSFSINLETGKWGDFATGDKGGDLISLVAYLEGTSQIDAAGKISECLHLTGVPGVPNVPMNRKCIDSRHSSTVKQIEKACSESVPPCSSTANSGWRPLLPIPNDATEAPETHPTLGRPTGRWTYRNKDGKTLCLVCRFDPSNQDRKVILPLSYCRNEDINMSEWRWQGLDKPRPLYNLDLMSQHPQATIIICEGEKAADAASQLLPAPVHVVTTPLNGTNGINMSEWQPLKGRKVILWPDNDEPGRKMMYDLAKLLAKVGATSVHCINLTVFQNLRPNPTDALPDKWDAADALHEGINLEAVSTCLNNPATLFNLLPSHAKPGRDFELIEDRRDGRPGVYFQATKDDGELAPKQWVCAPLKVMARTRNTESNGWGYLLEWEDQDSILHRWPLPAEMFSGAGEEYRRVLLDQGLEIAPGTRARNHLSTYIQTACTSVRVLCTNRTGWHDRRFVLPHKTIGCENEDIIYQSPSVLTSTYAEKGTLEEWRDEVGQICRGNSRLLFAVSLAFASVLLELTGDENGGFHYQGQSSEGKSSALMVAASVFGGHNFVQRWRATDNGLESVATLHNNTLLILDEIGQVDPKVAGEIAYMLANGSGKQRANRSGGSRQKQNWRLLFLSSGEIDLAQHMLDGGKKIRAGQEVRLLSLPANANCGLGVFEDLHALESGAEFSRNIQHAAASYHGTAGPAFIQSVCENFDALPSLINELRSQFLREVLPEQASGQVSRAADRFALVAIAGEMATRFGLTGWDPLEAERATQKCFNAWLETRGGIGNQETTQIISQVRQFFESHGESRFAIWNDESRTTINRAGFRKKVEQGWEYYVLPETFKNEICAGHDHRQVTQVLGEKGIIRQDGEGKNSISVTLPSIGKKRCYVTTEKLWEDT